MRNENNINTSVARHHNNNTGKVHNSIMNIYLQINEPAQCVCVCVCVCADINLNIENRMNY